MAIVLALLLSGLPQEELGFCGASPTAAGPLEVRSVRALDGNARTSVMILIRNRTDAAVTIQELKIKGAAIASLMEPADPKNPRSPGKGVDWYDLRPRTIPAGGAGTILLGYMVRELREPALELTAITDRGDAALAIPAPKPETLRVACAAFDAGLRALTIILRNDGPAPVRPSEVEFNGRKVDLALPPSAIAPGSAQLVTFAVETAYGQPCAVLVTADGGKATASFRAYPAESLNYPFYGQHSDKRDLAEKHMDVHVARSEGHAQVGEEMDRHGGRIPEALEKRMAKAAAQFGKRPDAWAWYMQDDAGWGRPRPQTLLRLGAFLRESGSPQPQFLCNPADLQRYAWTHDQYMNYEYHVTGQGDDPSVFGGMRSLDEIRELNEPAPILYLVDTVGQSVRWITRAEEDLASFAMLGRGARNLGWFLAPSVWDQGTNLHGGIDPLETRPWRYQEGATACVPVWNEVGNIAAVFKALQPWIAVSAPMRGQVREDGIEVLPLLCKDNLLAVVLLNRRLRCTYPRDYPDGSSSGSLRLRPHRNVPCSIPTPAGFAGRSLLAFDLDRGFRALPFSSGESALSVDVDALDTSLLILVHAEAAPLEAIRREALTRLRPSIGGSPIRPDVVLSPAELARRAWDDPAKNYRVELSVAGPRSAGSWVRASLPVEGSSLGTFAPQSVSVHAQGRSLPVKVDYFRPLYQAEEGTRPWTLGKDDRNAAVEKDEKGVRIVSKWKSGYGLLTLATPLDPRYDLLEIRREIQGNFQPLLPGANLRAALDGSVWGRSELIEAASPELPLSRILWKKMTGEKPGPIRLSAQIYEGTYRFGEIRQAKTSPEIYVSLPAEVKAGATFTMHAYWQPVAQLCKETPFLPEAERPAEAAEARVGGVDGFRISSADERGIVCESRAACAWIEGRDATGTLTGSKALHTKDGLAWTLEGTPPPGPELTVHAAGAHGRVVAVALRRLSPAARLREIARVTGQVESLSCADDGRMLAVGADKVYAFEESGKARWSFDLGENRRQQERYGPGRNVEQVEARGDLVAARTFRWNPKNRAYENSVEVTIGPDGRETSRVPWDWKSRPLPKQGAALPPYTLHRFELSGGRVLAASTQGVVRLVDPQGRAAWEQRRPARIDAARVFEEAGFVAIAWKRNPHRYDWVSVPTLELLSLKDGSTRELREGVAHDDFGHFGTDLALAGSKDGRRLFMGDPSGRLYVFEPK